MDSNPPAHFKKYMLFQHFANSVQPNPEHDFATSRVFAFVIQCYMQRLVCETRTSLPLVQTCESHSSIRIQIPVFMAQRVARITGQN